MCQKEKKSVKFSLDPIHFSSYCKTFAAPFHSQIFLKGFSTQTVSSFHVSNLLFSGCCLTSAAITHQKQLLSKLTTSRCQMQLMPFLLTSWVLRQQPNDKLSTTITFFYSPQDTRVSQVSSCLTIFLLPFVLSVSNGAKQLGFPPGYRSVQHVFYSSLSSSLTYHSLMV